MRVHLVVKKVFAPEPCSVLLRQHRFSFCRDSTSIKVTEASERAGDQVTSGI